MKPRNIIYPLAVSILMFGIFSCSTLLEGATPVKPFEKEKYLGKWYEIARMDFAFEKNMNNTTAEYSLNSNGSIKVDNNGFDTIKGKWKQAVGKAKFVGEEDVAMLKVSFFGPFYGGYNVVAIDPDYKYALVAGSSLDYLWVLSRETTMPDEVKKSYMKIAADLGYNTNDLIWVQHDAVQGGN